MIPVSYPSNHLSAYALRPGNLLREVATRQDRIPQDQRVDPPEIQESFRVSFSDETLADKVGDLGNEQHRQAPSAENPANTQKLQTYAVIAGL